MAIDVKAEVAKKLMERMSEGERPWVKGWASSGHGRPYNFESKKHYSGVNPWLLAMSGFSDPRWMTYRQAEKAGMQVMSVSKVGKSTSIVKVIQPKDKEEKGKLDEAIESGDAIELTGKGRPLYLRFYAVFNAAQIEGMPELVSNKRDFEPVERVERFLAHLKKTEGLVVLNGGDRCYYRYTTDSIQMPMRQDFISLEEYYAGLLHELGHWTGHATRLNRLSPTSRFGSPEYAKEEMMVEPAAAMLYAELGIKPSQAVFDNHAAYMQSWMKACKEDPNILWKSMIEAGKISDWLISREPKPELAEAPALILPEPIRARGMRL